MKKNITPLLAALIGCGALSGNAGAQALPDYLKFSGFGTLAVVQTNTDEAKFGRDRQAYGGATTNATADVDSDLGLQLSATANRWLSGTVQVLAVKRQTENYLTTEAEWGFVKVKPIEGLSIRGGRMATPMFLVSESRNVGFANTWLRAPNEVYGLVSFRRLQGFDLSYERAIGPTTLTVTALTGSSATKFGTTNFRMKGVKGVTALLETEWAAFRVGRVEAKYDTAASQAYSFTSYGMTVDRNNIVAQAEYVQKRAPAIVFAEADGWYVMGGYRFGSLLPYASYASTKPKTVHPANTSATQATTALGLRWDAYKGTALKFQFEHIDTSGTKGISFSGKVTSPVTVASAAVDFVF
jgi:hypothetical protein